MTRRRGSSRTFSSRSDRSQRRYSGASEFLTHVQLDDVPGSRSSKTSEDEFRQHDGVVTILMNYVTPLIQSYTNHAHKCVRSRSGTHGKISQHNSTNKIKSYKHHNTSEGPRGLEYKCSIIDESAEATISEYRHKLNKFALRRPTQTGIQIKRGAGLLPGILLSTPGRRQRAARNSRHLHSSRSRRRRWRQDPGLQHLVAATRRKERGKRGKKATVSTHPKYSQARSYTTYAWIYV